MAFLQPSRAPPEPVPQSKEELSPAENHYVPYETDEFARAHQWASENVARKYPGAVEMLTRLDSLIRQKLNAGRT